MIVKGRCRGNGAQLANYLLNTKDNVRADFMASYGASHGDPRRALLEMSLTSELSSRSKDGLYHMQLSPRADEAAEMTWEQKIKAVEITAEGMGLAGHKWALFEHEKEDGRVHMHLVFERYNHDTGRMWSDTGNYKKHEISARQMEMEFGWQLTHEKKNILDRDVKEHITDMYIESSNGAEFVAAMEKAGFEVTQGIDRRPYQIVDQYGTVHDLSRQVQGINQAAISEYLKDTRSDLRQTAEASNDRRSQYQQSQDQERQLDNSREMSDSQDLADQMISYYKQQDKEQGKEQETDKVSDTAFSYSFKFEQSPPLPRTPADDKKHSDNLWEMSDSQDRAAAMQEEFKRQESDRQEQQRKEEEIRQQAEEQTRATEDAASRMARELERYKKHQEELRAKNRDRGRTRTRERDGPDH